MKKTLLIAAAVAMSFVACSKEEIQTVGKGMTLSANVADDNTKATITKEGTTTWKFKWEAGDVVAVTAPNTTMYNFVKPETGDFKCEAAVRASGTWSAVYPADFTTNGLSFVGQDGTLESAMAKYYMTGSCTSDGSAILSMDMNPQVAILKVKNISGVNRSLYLKLATETKYFTKISKTGDLESTNMKSGAKLIELPASPSDKEYYIVIPVPNAKVTVVTNGSYSTDNRNVLAGKVYNVNVR